MSLAAVRAIATQETPVKSREYLESARHYLLRHLRGLDSIVDFSLATFLGRGHLLLEGAPGTGKTSLAKALAHAFGGTFHRVQMTSDLLPSDIVGILRLKPASQDFEFRPGPIFSHFLLADELNRTSPKTQSALLEAMAEATATVDGVTHSLPHPFFVVATQNPLESHGVYPLAESQLDRFMVQLSVISPDKADEVRIYEEALRNSTPAHSAEAAATVLNLEQTKQILQDVDRVHTEASVLAYATEIVRATRSAPSVASGASIRGGLQLLGAARGLAFVRGRSFVRPEDISDLAVPALAHRLCFSDGDRDTATRASIIQKIVEDVKRPR